MVCPRCGQNLDPEDRSCAACGRLESAVACARHSDRVAVGACVVCGTAACDEECRRQDVRHYLCPAHWNVEVVEGWAQIYTTASDVEAKLIRENLQAEGIDAAILSQKDHTWSVDVGELAQVRLLVPAYQLDAARTVLAQHMDERGEIVFACPTCGEAYGPEDEVCGSCGQRLPTTLA